jgi:hypothetical protein
LDVALSPKLHCHDVIVPVDVSVNVTARGAVPVVGLALKDATAGALTTIWWLTESVPPGPLTVNDAVYVPGAS